MSIHRWQPVVLLDLDGTLVDSVFHHVLAWDDALVKAGHRVPLWRIHSGIGMGGKRLVPWLLGGHVPEAADIADEHRRLFLEAAATLRPTPGAAALLDDLETREVPFIIATSAEAEVRTALLRAIGREDLTTADADDVESPKPTPDLLLASCRTLAADPEQATLIGDSPWDAEAADRIGMRCITVRCGGFGDDRLLAGGASAVVDDPGVLVGRL